MLLTLIIILILIGAAVIGSIYSNFIVFHSNFSESENYHKAYYASISALERGELVTKQRSPGYVGSGGFRMGIGTGSSSNSDGGSDKSLSNFSYFGNNTEDSSVFRTINSRTTRIPSEGKGDVEWMLSANDSPNYNMMGYENSEVFLLYYDKSDGNPYTNGDIIQSRPGSITGEIRLPQLLRSSWGRELDDQHSLLNTRNSPKDDAIVDRQIRGIYINVNDNDKSPFTIYSTQKTNEKNITYSEDSIFRESDINTPLQFQFTQQKKIIINNSKHSNRGKDAVITVVGKYANDIKGLPFENIFSNTNINNISLRFSLLNLLQTSTSGYIYPFLEYYANFGTGVSDKYYTINGEGNYKDYQVNTIIQKPTVKDSVLSNFTSIF